MITAEMAGVTTRPGVVRHRGGSRPGRIQEVIYEATVNWTEEHMWLHVRDMIRHLPPDEALQDVKVIWTDLHERFTEAWDITLVAVRAIDDEEGESGEPRGSVS
jgi:hypothetical protein